MKKRKTVEVDVGSRRAKRAAGDPLALDRLPKFRESGSPLPVRPERRRLESQRPKAPAPVDWMSRLLMVGVALLVLVALWAFLYYTVIVKLEHGDTVEQSSPPDGNVEPGRRDPAVANPGTTSRNLPQDQEAIDLVRRALATRFVSRVDDFFRFDAALDPTEIITFLEGMEHRDGLVVGMDVLDPVELAGQQVARVRVNFARGARQVSRMAMLVGDGKGEWKIDYEAFVARCQPGLGRLLAGEVDEAVVRVGLQLLEEDTEDGLRFRMHSPELEPAEFPELFCRYGSAQARALAALTYEADEPRRVTLVIRAAAGSGPRRLEVARVLAVDWVMFHPAHDLAFH